MTTITKTKYEPPTCMDRTMIVCKLLAILARCGAGVIVASFAAGTIVMLIRS